MIIYLKNGVIIDTADTLDKVTRNGIGNLTGISWTRAPGGVGLYYIDLSQVAAVVEHVPAQQPKEESHADQRV